jgi:hypothetical protein
MRPTDEEHLNCQERDQPQKGTKVTKTFCDLCAFFVADSFTAN